MKAVAIMPIKLNNERLPGKNVMMLGNKPLLCHALENLLLLGCLDEIYVYCSEKTVCKYLPKGVTFLKRSEILDAPTSNFNQIFESFMEQVESDIYIYAHATAPFVTVETMRECLGEVMSGRHDSAFCAKKIQDFLWKDAKPLNFDPCNLPRSQDLEPIYEETSGIYVFTRECYLKTRRRIGLNPFIKEVTFKESVDINEKEDFELAEKLIGD